MAWYDGIVESVGEVWDTTTAAVGEVYNEYLGAATEREKEVIRDRVSTEPRQAPIPGQVNQIDWTKWGVIVSAVGVVLLAYKAVK